MAEPLQIWVGNLPPITDVIEQGDPPTVYPLAPGTTVRFKMRPAHSATLTVDAPATIVSLALAQVSYQTVAPNTAVAGNYAAWWEVTLAGNTISTSEFNVSIDAHAPLTFTASGPTVGPCAPWLTGAQVDAFCSSGASMAGGPDFDLAAEMASSLLFELSGRLFAGACQSTVRPCAQQCGCWGGFIGTLAIAGASALGVPINWTSGVWECGGNSCGCGVLSEIVLDGYPVTSIVNVKINGAVIPSSAYRLDQYRRLVCANQQLWPACQDLTAPDTQQGTWSVTYTHGQEPPLAGKQAAAQLACQLKLAMGGLSCQLSESVQKVTRQGISVEKGKIASLVNALGENPTGTGLALVDAFLAAYNRGGLRRRPAVWSPDSPRYGRRIT